MKKIKLTSNSIDYNSIQSYLFPVNDPSNQYQDRILASLKNEENIHSNFLSLLTNYAKLFLEYQNLSIFSKSASKVQKFISSVKDYKDNFLKVYIEILEAGDRIDELTTSMRSISILLNSSDDKLKQLQEKSNFAKINLLNIISQMSAYIGLNLNILKYRIDNLKSNAKNKHSQKIVNHVIKFMCLNPGVQWSDVHRVYNQILAVSNEFEPINDQNFSDIINLFKDESLTFLKFETLYELVFGNKHEHPRVKWSNSNHLKNVLLQFFPFMLISFQKNDFILDITKMDLNGSEIIESLLFFIEYEDSLKKGIKSSDNDIMKKIEDDEGTVITKTENDINVKQENSEELGNSIETLYKSFEDSFTLAESNDKTSKLEEIMDHKTLISNDLGNIMEDKFSHLKSKKYIKI